MKKILSKNDKETKKIGRDFAATLNNNNRILCLYGNLGSGKTTFTQGLAEYFGIKRIISPTFILVRSYKINAKFQTLHHIDLYRLDKIGEIINLGFEEIINDKNNLVVIEWAEKASDILPKKRINIRFKWLSVNEREISYE